MQKLKDNYTHYMITVNNRREFLIECSRLLPKNGSINCVEIGCYQGEFSEQICQVLYVNKLYLIDSFLSSGNSKYPDGLYTSYSGIDDFRILLLRLADCLLTEQVEIIPKYSYEAVSRIQDNSCEFLYHDACHLKEDLKRDLIEWLPKLKSNGLVCGHDYNAGAFPGVKQAVDEFCAEHNFEMIIFNENGGDYALRAKSYS
jgi:hypothetical protein